MRERSRRPFNILLQMDPEAAQDQQRLTQSFDTPSLRGDVPAVGEVFAVILGGHGRKGSKLPRCQLIGQG